MVRVLAVLMLAGCATVPEAPAPAAPPAAPSSPEASLHLAWELEVDDAVAGFTAVRPRLTAVDSPVLALFDAQLEGLKALAGSPNLASVEAKSRLLGTGKGTADAIAKLRADKAALDAKTTALEGAARKAELERAAAEARATAAAEQAIRAEAASNLSRVAVLAIGAGIVAFLFGHWVGIPRWAAAATVGLGVLTATTAPQLLAFFGSDNAQTIMAATFAVLALGGIVSLGLWTWRRIFPAPSTPCDDNGTPPPQA